jgi:hypothetical protein
LRFVVEMAVKYTPGLPTSATEDMQRRDAHTSRPEGLVTRGKTAPNRLRRVDHFCLAYDPQLIRRLDGPYARALFVDLGYGEDPDTALESARRFRRLNPELGVLGVEIEAERVERAQPHADGHTHFRLGGFNLPLRGKESVRMIRAFNVLRQYEEAEALPAIERLAGQMLPGGLLVEGTSDPFGRVWTANLVLGRGQHRRPEGLGAHLRPRLQGRPVVPARNPTSRRHLGFGRVRTRPGRARRPASTRFELPNYEDEIQISTGCAVVCTGELVESQGKGQSVELQAAEVQVLGLGR